ncbi:MAG TPA: NAD-dependent epimerase/dehydratase family protein [Thermoplasmata archaeon]|nr:NAD-dependent epimerase/dehydratase family protein [Thermoplasmata archaeon]
MPAGVVASGGGPVLVAGATGFLGRAIVRALASSGRTVLGLMRNPERAEWVRAAGGYPVRGDVLDERSLERAASGVEAIVHVAAHPGSDEDDAESERRVRVEGTDHLARAARANGVRRLVVGSGYWVYASSAGLLTEDSATDPRGESAWNFDAERVALAANRPGLLETVVVRPGMVYGDGAWFRATTEALQRGDYVLIAPGTNRWSFVSLEDAAAGFVTVLDRGAPGSVYDLADGAPVEWIRFIDLVCREMGKQPPTPLEPSVARGTYGPVVTDHLSADRAMTAARLRALGWEPRDRDCGSGVPPLLRAIARSERA